MTDLTERYVDAAMRSIPEKQRADLATELHGSIADQIEARIADGDTAASAERAVLTALGDPDKLTAEYMDRPLWLIGPRYFLDWWRLLKLLLWIVLPCVAFAVALGKTIAGAGVGETIGTVSVVLLHTAVHLGFWTTLVFAIVERASDRSDGAPLAPWSLDRLPERRTRGAGRADMIATLLVLGVTAGAVLWDRFIGFVPAHPGLSFLDHGLWPGWTTALFVVLALEAVVAVAVYAARRWTIRLVIANGMLNLAVAIPALWLLTSGGLLNRDFWPTLVPAASAGQVASVVAALVGFGIAGVALWDIVDSALKAARARAVR